MVGKEGIIYYLLLQFSEDEEANANANAHAVFGHVRRVIVSEHAFLSCFLAFLLC